MRNLLLSFLTILSPLIVVPDEALGKSPAELQTKYGKELQTRVYDNHSEPEKYISNSIQILKQDSEEQRVLLEESETLFQGDALLSDGSLYDEYFFEGQAGQVIKITLESSDFDTYLLLDDPAGMRIDENDDSYGTNSRIVTQLPTTGRYRLLVNAYDDTGTGNYSLRVVEATPEDLQKIEIEIEAEHLVQEGLEFFSLGQFRDAEPLFEDSLELLQQADNKFMEGEVLFLSGVLHSIAGEYSDAIELGEQTLNIAQQVEYQELESAALFTLALTHIGIGEYSQSAEFVEGSLTVARAIENPVLEASALYSLGIVRYQLGSYQESREAFEQALALINEFDDSQVEGIFQTTLLLAMFEINDTLGQNRQALQFLEEGVSIESDLFGPLVETNLALAQASELESSGSYQDAIRQYDQVLSLSREIGIPVADISALNGLSYAHYRLGDYIESVSFAEQALVGAQSIGNRAEQSYAFHNLGRANRELGNHQLATDYYENSLSIARETGDRSRESWVLSSLGYLYQANNQSELAIVFLKQAINVRESIRQGITDQDLLKSYTDTVDGPYRYLANLLLEQGRIPEAQQVLDLLQLEEIREFTDTRAEWTTEGILHTDAEKLVVDAHTSLIALGEALIKCENEGCAKLTEYIEQQELLLYQYNDEVDHYIATVQANRRNDEVFQDPSTISGDAQVLLETYTAEGQTPILIYPFVLEDKLWLVWVTVGNVVGSVEVPISQGQLSADVQEFGALLKAPNSDVGALQSASKRLYDSIILPIAADLEANDITHLVFVNDRVTRYIPMAALYDGEQYLAQRYTISTVLTPAATDMGDRLTTVEDSPVLGLGLTQAVGNLNALPGVYRELTAIVRDDTSDGIYPGQVLFDDAFTLESLKENVSRHRVLHMATHAEFVPGQARESFIVMGDGTPLKITDINQMERQLRNLHLVVLSACETALGGENQDGSEITGLSSYFLRANRAEAVLASLWAVSDGNTSLLMQRFYENLASGDYSKAEALRQAQLSFLTSDQTDTGNNDRNFAQREAEDSETTPLSHPYYWAPFTLIGNSL